MCKYFLSCFPPRYEKEGGSPACNNNITRKRLKSRPEDKHFFIPSRNPKIRCPVWRFWPKYRLFFDEGPEPNPLVVRKIVRSDTTPWYGKSLTAIRKEKGDALHFTTSPAVPKHIPFCSPRPFRRITDLEAAGGERQSLRAKDAMLITNSLTAH